MATDSYIDLYIDEMYLTLIINL